jgi:hypothetical protein
MSATHKSSKSDIIATTRNISLEKIKKDFLNFFQSPQIIQKIIVNHINNRSQDFPDPITSTLVLMVSSPMQVVFCEGGVLLFKTSNLPVLPFNILTKKERNTLRKMMDEIDSGFLQETYHGCGKFSVQVNIGVGNYIQKKTLLLAFVDIMKKQKEFKEKCIIQRLSDIIVQRFLSNISVQSDDITLVIQNIWEGSSQINHAV